MGIRQMTIFHDLQEHVLYIRMGFFYLIQQNDAVRVAADLLRQLPRFFVSDISRWRTDDFGHGVLLHVLTHVEPDH